MRVAEGGAGGVRGGSRPRPDVPPVPGERGDRRIRSTRSEGRSAGPGVEASIPPPATLPGIPAVPPPTKFKILRPLKIRDFALLWMGMTVSLLGDGIYFVALTWKVLQLSDGSGALAIAGVAWTAPQVLFALWGGVLADRFDRRHVMIGADITRGIAIGALGILSIGGNLELWHIYVLVAIYGTGDAFFMPAFGAIVPDVVTKDLLTQANSLDQFVRPLALFFIGPGVGGLLVSWFGAGPSFLIDASTFAVSALAVLLMRARPTRQPTTSDTRSVLKEVAEGMRFVRSQTWLWAGLIASALGLLFFYGPNRVLVPFIIEDKLGGDAGELGLVYACGGVGAVLASMFMGERGLPKRHVTFMFVSWGLATLGLSGYALATETWHAMIVASVLMAAGAVGVIVWYTLLQTLVPNELLGRVTSLDWLVSTALIPASFALSAPLGSALGEEETLLGAGILGAAAFTLILIVPGVRDIEKRDLP
ncbi:MAG: MFS transporter [Actinomycetota bacterium]